MTHVLRWHQKPYRQELKYCNACIAPLGHFWTLASVRGRAPRCYGRNGAWESFFYLLISQPGSNGTSQ